MQKDNLVLRGRLFDFDKVLFGVFLVVVERSDEDSIFNVNAALGRSQFVSIFDIGTPPIEEVLKGMSDLLFRGEATIADSKKLENILTKNKNLIMKLLEQEDMQNTLHMALSSRLNLFFEAKFELTLESHLSDEPYEYHDLISEIALKFSYEETSNFRKQFALPNDVDIVRLAPCLSVNGKYVLSLQKGDLLYCVPEKTILENSLLVEHHELLDEQGELKKLIGTVEFIRPMKDNLIFIVQVSHSLYGAIQVPNNVLIEVPMVEDIHDEHEEETQEEETPMVNWKMMLKEYTDKILHNPFYALIFILVMVIFIFLLYGSIGP